MSDRDPAASVRGALAGMPTPLPPRGNGPSLGERVTAIVSGVRSRLTPAQLAALDAAAVSSWKTGVAIAGGLTANWWATGHENSLLDYARAHAVGWVVTNLITPSVSAYLTHRDAVRARE